MSARDAVVVGSGPNGLAAAITLAREGLDVLVVEGATTPGGGLRSGELTLPVFLHDTCAAVHPMAAGSPFLSGLPLEDHGLEWVHPPLPLAHPLDGGRCTSLHRSLRETTRTLADDGPSWAALVRIPKDDWQAFAADALGPPLRWPTRPLQMARFGALGLRSASGLIRSRLRTVEAQALLAGCAAHSFLPLNRSFSAGVALALAGAAHAVGWPIARGGSGRLAEAMVGTLEAFGGEIRTGWHVRTLAELPPSRAVLLDLTPRQVLEVAGPELPKAYRRRLARYRYGPAAFKVDWALDGAIPWAAEDGRKAGTVHLGGTLEEIEAAERAPWEGRIAVRPFVLLSEPSTFDPERAPPGKGVAWGYCHVPHGWHGDPQIVLDRIELQIERFAPGFRDCVLARSVRGPEALEEANPNLVGGDINGGVQDLRQFLARPVLARDPYATPVNGLFLCSSSTPPGGGSHGMCGHHAARSVLRRVFHAEVG